MSEGFNLPETRRFIRTNKEKETKEHERQDFWSFAACGKILYASDRNSPCCRFVAWYRQFLHKWNNYRYLWIAEDPGKWNIT